MPILFWAHGALSALVLLARALPPKYRDIFVRVVCLAGLGFAVALFVERRSGAEWRTTEVDPTSTALAAMAVGVAWVLAAALVDEDDRWRAASLVGLGGSSLILFAETDWTVPALLFWTLSSLAVGALGSGLYRRAEFWIGVVLADLCFVAGMVGHIVDSDSWELPLPAPDKSYWLLFAAVVLRAGVLPRYGMWRALGGPAAPALPLLVGSALVLASGVTGRVEPWATAGLLVVALAMAIAGSIRRTLAPADFTGWPVAVSLALMYATPAVTAVAGCAAILSVGVLALWNLASGRAQPERGLALSLMPLTAAFGAVVYAAKRAFDLATTIDDLRLAVPWTVVAGLIPLVMAAGALLGARVGRERGTPLAIDPPVIATWLLVAASLALGTVPGAIELPDDVIGTQSSFLTLLLVAIGAGVVAGGLWTLRHPDHRRAPAPEPVAQAVGPPTRFEALAFRPAHLSLVEKLMYGVALVLALASVGGVAWATYEGLSQGFL